MTNNKVKAKVKLLKHQHEFVHEKSLYPALVGGYGSGKTDAGINRMLNLVSKYGPMFKAHGRIYYFGVYEPTYDLIRRIIYPRLESILTALKIQYNLNKSEKTLTIPKFNTIIIFRSMENESVIIGYEHSDSWIDELDTLKIDKAERVFNSIEDRNRAPKPNGDENTTSVTTTPEGYNFCYNKWYLSDDPDFKIIYGKTENNVFLKKSYAKNIRKRYSAEIAEAYLNGKFVNMSTGSVYKNFSRQFNNTNLEITKRHEELHIGLDFNVDKMSAVVAILDDDDHEIHVCEELCNILDTPTMIEIIKERYKGKTIHVYPDPSGHSRKSNDATKTDIQLLKKAGFLVHAKTSHDRVKDRVQSVQGLILNAEKKRRLFVNVKNCPTLTKNLEQQAWDEKTQAPDKKSGHDHMNDALGYLVHKIYPVKRQLFLSHTE